MLRILCALVALCLVPAVDAAGAEVDSGGVYCFSPEDFSGGDLAGICITGLPQGGATLLGSRVLQPGDILTARQLGQMTFTPADTEVDRQDCLTYLPIFEGRVEEAAAMTIGIRGKVNREPIAQDSALETYRDLPNTGTLRATDPEGGALTYTLTCQPRRGTVTIADDGTFTYTPGRRKVGIDSFRFTATDQAGKVSREATVTITILKPSGAPQYTDTLGRECRFAAEWMKHTGIFVGEQPGDSPCFSPDKAVTQGEFLAMVVKALELPTDAELSAAGYEDCPQWLQPYLAAAVRSGLTEGLAQPLRAGDAITEAQAAALLRGALAPEDAEAFSAGSDALLTRETAAGWLYRAARLA